MLVPGDRVVEVAATGGAVPAGHAGPGRGTGGPGAHRGASWRESGNEYVIDNSSETH